MTWLGIGPHMRADHFRLSLATSTQARKGFFMYRSLHRFAFVLPLILVSLMGCASTRTHESPGEYVDDSVITMKVKSAILGDESLKSSEINVETFKGTVQLSGFVNSQADINKAVVVAKNVGGVTSVKNDMQLKKASP